MTNQTHLPDMEPGPAGLMHEQTFNEALAEALRSRRRVWGEDDGSIIAERYDVFDDAVKLRPDILVKPRDVYPVVIEVEFGEQPAFADARAKLGRRVVGTSDPVRSAIAVGAPPEIRHWSNERLREQLAHPSSVELHYAILSANVTGDEEGEVTIRDSDVHIWPSAGHATGTVDDLAMLCEYAPAPPGLVSETAEYIARRIHSLADNLFVNLPPGTAGDIARTLGQHDEKQGLRMAYCIWLTSLRLHDLLASKSTALQSRGLRSIHDLRYTYGVGPTLVPHEVIQEWDKILEVNYGSVFSAARAIMVLRIPTMEGGDALEGAAAMAARVSRLRLGNRVDFAGELFPLLLDDREETAAHYTLPETAELLATLAVERIPIRDWTSSREVSSLRVADFACGTGALLRAAYQCIRQKHEAAGGRSRMLHRMLIERSITGLDINELAAHMTAAGLSTAEIETDYETDNIAAIALTGGRTGSLELIELEQIADVTGQDARSATNNHNHEQSINIEAPHHSQDLVIQNPPYSRARRGRRMFDVTGITEAQRKRSVDRLNKIRGRLRKEGNEVTNGQAGLGADFSALADRKLKPGGIFATVLPLTAAKAESWEGFRKTIERDYHNILTIAFSSHRASMMSADTHMNEMLLIATKRRERKNDDEDARVACVNLNTAPESVPESRWYAKTIGAIDWSKGNSGVIYEIGKMIGSWTIAPPMRPGFPWFAVGVRNHHLSAAAADLMQGQLYSPANIRRWEFDLRFTTLDEVAGVGPTHHLIGHPRGGDGQGAFTFDKTAPGEAPIYPSLWAVDAETQKSILTLPTHSGEPAVKDKDVLREMIAHKSDLFISRNLGMVSQALSAARTPDPAMGGSTWTALESDDEGVKVALALWLNSTMGLMVRTAYGQTTQQGRSRMQIRALEGLPVPDFAADSKAGERARSVARQRFAGLSVVELQPVSYAFQDERRGEIDDAALAMLGLADEQGARGALAELRRLWCEEPAVHGGNKRIMRALGIT